jgi:hypothetical protein
MAEPSKALVRCRAGTMLPPDQRSAMKQDTSELKPATEIIQSLVESRFGENSGHSSEIDARSHDTVRGTISFWMYFRDHFADVCAWDHAYCLDILVYREIGSDDIVWSEAGSCGDEAALRARFDRFCDWIVQHEPTGA